MYVRFVVGVLSATMVAGLAALGSSAGDAAKGEMAFSKRCTGCHTLDHDKVGPHLAGVFGRKAGKAPGFVYSDALKSSNFVWNEELLDKWLSDPDSVVADVDMAFRLNDQAERADIIAFLKEKSK
jgi:cytochrome c